MGSWLAGNAHPSNHQPISLVFDYTKKTENFTDPWEETVMLTLLSYTENDDLKKFISNMQIKRKQQI